MEKPPTPYYELKPAEKKEQQVPLALNRSNAEMLRQFHSLTKEQLALKLSNTQLVENGYAQRDLALGCLVQFHYFDLEKALEENIHSLQKRTIAYGRYPNGTLAEIILFPGLSNIHYKKIIEYAHREKWPLTSKGLFLQIKEALSHKKSPEPSLIDAFFLTPEFLATELIFNRSNTPLEKSEIILILSEGSWDIISSFTEQQRALQDLSEARRQKLLLDLIDYGSKAAAYTLLKTDGRFAATKLDDAHVIQLLNHMKEKTDLAQQYALALIKSPRSDSVLKMAAQRLYEYAGETPPKQFSPDDVLLRFVQNNIPLNPGKPKEAPIGVPPIQPKLSSVKTNAMNNKKSFPQVIRYYIVQEGDSLWKISKLYKEDVESIKKINHLESDFLKPGTTLKIPISK